jgi:2'-5' RNA ligase
VGKWAIVAIPEQDDPVWKISSEQIPHLTILYLGEHENSELEAPVLSYLEHATETVLHRFGLSVDRRGTLGPKDADVIFFEKAYLPKDLEVFRSSLLKDPTILGFFNSADQYKNWTPHLTLGFPETPAKPDNRDYPGLNQP